jgi:hypothetical protein
VSVVGDPPVGSTGFRYCSILNFAIVDSSHKFTLATAPIFTTGASLVAALPVDYRLSTLALSRSNLLVG